MSEDECGDVRSSVSDSTDVGCLYPLWHDVDQGKRSAVTFAELQAALPPIYSVPWTQISERLLLGTSSKLDKLSEQHKAALLLLRLFK